MCCDGRRGGRAPGPPGLQTQHCEGRVPPPSGFYSCTAEYLMPGAAPLGAAPSFIFLTKKKKDKRRAGGRWWRAAVCLLWGWGSRGMARGGLQGSCSPFRKQGSCPPSPVPRGYQGGLAQPEGLGGRAEPCRAAGQLALVSVPVAGVLPQLSPPPRWAQPLPPQAGLAPRGGGRVARGGRLCPAMPAALSEPFSSQMLYYEIVLLWEVNYGGVAQWASPGAACAASGAAVRAGVGPRQPGVLATPGMYLWW